MFNCHTSSRDFCLLLCEYGVLPVLVLLIESTIAGVDNDGTLGGGQRGDGQLMKAWDGLLHFNILINFKCGVWACGACW